eukprot:jgi/Chlat1/7568/Chrsp63S07081
MARESPRWLVEATDRVCTKLDRMHGKLQAINAKAESTRLHLISISTALKLQRRDMQALHTHMGATVDTMRRLNAEYAALDGHLPKATDVIRERIRQRKQLRATSNAPGRKSDYDAVCRLEGGFGYELLAGQGINRAVLVSLDSMCSLCWLLLLGQSLSVT